MHHVVRHVYVVVYILLNISTTYIILENNLQFKKMRIKKENRKLIENLIFNFSRVDYLISFHEIRCMQVKVTGFSFIFYV